MISWKHGAHFSAGTNSTTFRVWAPLAQVVNILFTESGNLEEPYKTQPLEPAGDGYWQLIVNDCPPGTRYGFSIDDKPARPDPASRYQPDGVHRASAVVDAQFNWRAQNWAGLPLEEYIIYEAHIGTLTDEGTFDSAIAELPRMKALGITAVEIMPVAQFPGDRNWGYDGVYPYAVAESYGGIKALQRFVDAAHSAGIAVILDVVYNHLGPEGNYLSYFGPYFNDDYHTPWGAGLNFDAEFSDGVRDFFIGNAVFWTQVCHIDALRLDAVHAIIDTSARPFLQQLSETVHEVGRKAHRRVHVIGENDRNDPNFAKPANMGGIGADSQWSDDFHHALHTILTGESHGYYSDFGKVSQLAKAYTDGFIYDGVYSEYRKRHHGSDSRALEGIRFVAFTQNHDQVGNRPDGTRLSMLLNFKAAKVAAAALLAAPYIPLIFMGEEFGSVTPFLYFVSHGDDGLIQAVRQGRAREFQEFFAKGEPVDPQSEEAFLKSKLKNPKSPESGAINRVYTELLRLRREFPALHELNKRRTSAYADDLHRTMVVRRHHENSSLICLFNFGDETQLMKVPAEAGTWRILFHTESADYLGTEPAAGTRVNSAGEIQFSLPGSSAVFLAYDGPEKSSTLKQVT